MSIVDTQLLACLQLADSAFPSGFYTLSHGLEGYVQASAIAARDTKELLADLLVHSIGPSDATALALAHRAAFDTEQLIRVDHKLYACKMNRSTRQAAQRTGKQLLDMGRVMFSSASIDAYWCAVHAKTTPGCQAVVAGLIYSVAGTSQRQAVISDLFALASSFTQAALKLQQADFRQAQVILHETLPLIEQVATDAVNRPLDELHSSSPLADIFGAQHEFSNARLFAT